MAKKNKVCRNCKRFTIEKACPICKSNNMSVTWKGIVFILNTEGEVARKLNINEEGKYALYVE